MSDPVTIGVLAASALTMAAEAGLKGAVGAAAKDAYEALKGCVARWGKTDVAALEKDPATASRQAVIAEIIDQQPPDAQAEVRKLAERLVAALKVSEAVGVEVVGKLDALAVKLGDIAVTNGFGARFGEVTVTGAFETGNITVGSAKKKT